MFQYNRYRQSEFGRWKDCRRAHHWQYTEGLYPTSPEGQLPSPNKSDIGTYAHVGFEVLHNGDSVGRAAHAMLLHHMERFDGESSDAWDKTVEYANGAIRHYDEWLKEGHMLGQEVLGVEMEWEAPLPHDRVAFGKLDLAVHDPLTGVVVVDMKTVSTLTDTPEDADFQLRTYAWAYWKNNGVVPARAEHRMVKRVLFGGTAKGPFVGTHGIHINQTILEAHEAQMIEMATEIDRARESEVTSPYLYPSPGKDCSWKCNYRDICPLVDDDGDIESVVQLSYVRTSDEQ